MPWDGTDLWTAVFNDDGTLGTLLHLAGGQDEAVVHPQFAEDGALYFVSDRSGWWNLHSWQGHGDGAPLAAMAGKHVGGALFFSGERANC